MPLQKNKIVEGAHGMVGGTLKAYVEEQFQVIFKERNVKTNGAVGKFYDDADLKKKYKDKPADYENIKANGYSFECPIKKKRFYEDIEYCSSHTSTQETEKIHEMRVQAEK